MDELMKYAMKRAYLNQLSRSKLLSDREYDIVKNDLMIRHKITGFFSKYQSVLKRTPAGLKKNSNSI